VTITEQPLITHKRTLLKISRTVKIPLLATDLRQVAHREKGLRMLLAKQPRTGLENALIEVPCPLTITQRK
jgi:hypothetical protein